MQIGKRPGVRELCQSELYRRIYILLLSHSGDSMNNVGNAIKMTFLKAQTSEDELQLVAAFEFISCRHQGWRRKDLLRMRQAKP